MDIKDFPKWENFCKKSNKETKYNLLFDSRFISAHYTKGNDCRCVNIPYPGGRVQPGQGSANKPWCVPC